jgi:hypothetical protein
MFAAVEPRVEEQEGNRVAWLLSATWPAAVCLLLLTLRYPALPQIPGNTLPCAALPAEPMINLGSHRDKTWPDGWTSVTEDGQRSAQFEHTLVITPTGCELLTGRLPASPPLWWEVEAGAAQQQGSAAEAAAPAAVALASS